MTETNSMVNNFSLEQYRIADYIHWYPAIEQQRMMDAWTADNAPGTWTHTGRVGADDRTVITPQADVNYGYCWFNVSNGPLTIEVPAYERYCSVSIFDMHHFVEDVIVAPDKPIVVRLANQKSPVADAHEVVLGTVSGVALLRMVIPTAEDEDEVMALTREVRSTGGDGNLPFITPDFTEEERAAALDVIESYSMMQTTGDKSFAKSAQGVGDLDRAGGVFAGQLGIPASYVQYAQYVAAPDGSPLGNDGSYEITINPHGLFRNDNGYCSITIYNMADRYLIPNPAESYSITSYTAVPNADGTITVRINPDGTGDNAIPTMGNTIYAVMRVYEPEGTVAFPGLVVVG